MAALADVDDFKSPRGDKLISSFSVADADKTGQVTFEQFKDFYTQVRTPNGSRFWWGSSWL